MNPPPARNDGRRVVSTTKERIRPGDLLLRGSHFIDTTGDWMHFPPRLTPAIGLAALLALGFETSAGCQDRDTLGVSTQSTQTASNAAPSAAPLPDAPAAKADDPAESGTLSGTVLDSNGDLIPGATVVVDDGKDRDRRSMGAGDNGQFQFGGLAPGNSYRVLVSAPGFKDWTSPALTLSPGQFQIVSGIELKLANAESSVVVYSSTEQIATQQVRIEEQQRVLGFIPNFYVVYDSKNAVPMTTKLKFQMALRVSIDPITFAGSAFLAGINQAADTPDYREGAIGYGQRFGAVYTDGLTDILFGGAILPSLLHQDPRYFYQGTGTKKSRLMHALANPFICRGDNGNLQPNYSSIGGDLISSSLSNLYYPESNRGAGIVFENVAISTAERAVSSIFQEFVVKKLTPSARKQN